MLPPTIVICEDKLKFFAPGDIDRLTHEGIKAALDIILEDAIFKDIVDLQDFSYSRKLHSIIAPGTVFEEHPSYLPFKPFIDKFTRGHPKINPRHLRKSGFIYPDGLNR